MKVFITGASGLIGSSVAKFYLARGADVIGIDNNMRQKFFGMAASTLSQEKLLKKNKRYLHFHADIRNQTMISRLFSEYTFDLIVHTAAQPSHDKAKEIPLVDFDINARGTLQLLELTRQHQPQAVFVFTSTNKVYGDNPNKVHLVEKATRFEYRDIAGIDETMSVDQNIHSLFGVSKLAADEYVQEYGRNFGLKTAIFRLGCVTGSTHASTVMHGFLSFLIKSLVQHQAYTIIGYRGKQVRDQIHAADVVQAIQAVYEKPSYGEVFNLGGGHANSISVLELISLIEKKLGIKAKITYQDVPRVGDHICYITDMGKFQKCYPAWTLSRSLPSIIDEVITYEQHCQT